MKRSCYLKKQWIKAGSPGFAVLFLMVFLQYTPSLSAQSLLYGMTSTGGPYGNGTIFRIKPDGNDFEVIYDFPAEHSEENPGNMTLAQNGKLYGTTQGGGPNGFGVIFEFDPATGIYRKLFDLAKVN